jgi:hypothetical protein
VTQTTCYRRSRLEARLLASPNVGIFVSSDGRGGCRGPGGPYRRFGHFVNVADYMTRHDTESRNDQNDANQLPRPQLSGDTEIDLTEHEKLRFLEVVRA